MDANAALKSYRHMATTQPNMSAAMTSFQGMNPGDQRELLFWMVMHSNAQIAATLTQMGIHFTANKAAPKDN